MSYTHRNHSFAHLSIIIIVVTITVFTDCDKEYKIFYKCTYIHIRIHTHAHITQSRTVIYMPIYSFAYICSIVTYKINYTCVSVFNLGHQILLFVLNAVKNRKHDFMFASLFHVYLPTFVCDLYVCLCIHICVYMSTCL